MAHWVKITACDDTTNILPVANFGQSVWEGMNNCTWSEYSTVQLWHKFFSQREGNVAWKTSVFGQERKHLKIDENARLIWYKISYRHRSLSLIHWWWCYPTTWCLLLVLGPRQALCVILCRSFAFSFSIFTSRKLLLKEGRHESSKQSNFQKHFGPQKQSQRF